VIRRMVFAIALLGLVGCATQRPVFYPNVQFKRAGSAVEERDTDDCMGRGEEYVTSNGRVDGAVMKAATEAATSATIGGAAGAAGGVIVGRAGTWAQGALLAVVRQERPGV